jgi:hypothetical protein
MKIVHQYSHLGGIEIMSVRYPEIFEEVISAITQVKPNRTKVSKEKTSLGVKLISPVEMNSQFKRHFPAVPVAVILIDE